MFMCNTLEDKVFVWADGHFSIVSKVTLIQVAKRFFYPPIFKLDLFHGAYDLPAQPLWSTGRSPCTFWAHLAYNNIKRVIKLFLYHVLKWIKRELQASINTGL